MKIIIVTPGHRTPDRMRPPAHRHVFAFVRRLLRCIHISIRWCGREFGAPVLCFICVYIGVLSTMLLPGVLVPATDGIVLSPVAALPLAILVVDIRAYKRWHGSKQTRMGIRMLRACSDGITWWCVWWRSRS